MTKKEVLKWRLAEKPTPSAVIDLLNTGILTKEEAKEILFSQETAEDRDKKSLESEIKFLRELVDKLAKGNTNTIVETIRYIEKPYQRWDWYQPYVMWCGNTATIGSTSASWTLTSGTNSVSSNGTGFSNISTF